MRRKKMSRGKSKKLFRRTAKRVHRKNLRARPMRGGIRM
uniref:Uncharacterized protein n=1 Tax=Gokushovirinae environmental samples TaxID=1478972 RepID=A0A2R3UAJ0_9VIRU|nr:hypothetical protein [Gokushovirinae environmental samples]